MIAFIGPRVTDMRVRKNYPIRQVAGVGNGRILPRRAKIRSSWPGDVSRYNRQEDPQAPEK